MGQAGGQFSKAGAVRTSGAGSRLGWWWLEHWMKFMEAGRGASLGDLCDLCGENLMAAGAAKAARVSAA